MMHVCVDPNNSTMYAIAEALSCASAGYGEYVGAPVGALLVRFDDAYFPDALGTAALMGGVVSLWGLAWAIRSLRHLASNPNNE